MSLARGDGIALWRKVETALAAELSRLPPDGDRRLPTERELADRFGVNRHTVRQAVRALGERGLVRTEQGRGTFAADVLVDYHVGARTRFTANLLAQDRTPGHEVLAVATGPAAPACAEALGLADGALVLERFALGLADGVPVSVGRTWFPLARFPDGAAHLRRDASVTAFFVAHGIGDYRRRSTRILARTADADEARRLRQAVGAPVLVTAAVDVDGAGAPVSFALTAWASERVQLVVEAG